MMELGKKGTSVGHAQNQIQYFFYRNNKEKPVIFKYLLFDWDLSGFLFFVIFFHTKRPFPASIGISVNKLHQIILTE